MKLSEKLKVLRKENKLTQYGLAKATNCNIRTIANYEGGFTYPRTHELYRALADALHVNVNYLLTEDETFLLEAKDRYKDKGIEHAKMITEELVALFEGGSVDEEDKDELMKSIQEAYNISKAKN